MTQIGVAPGAAPISGDASCYGRVVASSAAIVVRQGWKLMFCSECGAKGVGKFCSSCGTKLLASAARDERDGEPSVVPMVEWVELIDYEQLMTIPAVRDRIARAAAQAKKKMKGEDFLDLYGKALGGLGGVSLPMAKLAGLTQSAYAKLGVKTGKSRSATLATPPGEVLVRLLCSLAKEGRTLRDVHQLSDGCIVKAALLSDLLALEGDLIIAVRRVGGATLVEASTDIPGQMFDWGKSTRCLESLLSELGSAAA